MADELYDVVVEKDVMVAMRDGVRLATDLYFPDGAVGALPVVLIRTPYNKKAFRGDNSESRFFAGQGFVVAVQDKRGRYESEGLYTVSGGDGPDGYDSVDWLAKQSWSNGKVGTYGCSYLGDVQIFQAPQRHPNLAAMIPQASGSSIGSAWRPANGVKEIAAPDRSCRMGGGSLPVSGAAAALSS